MIAGYLGMLPLLQSLAAEPAWPDAPPAVANATSAPQVVTFVVPPAAQTNAGLAVSKPTKVKQAKKNAAKAAKRTTPRAGSPARATGSNTNANRGSSSSNASNFGSGGSNDGSLAGGSGSGACVGC